MLRPLWSMACEAHAHISLNSDQETVTHNLQKQNRSLFNRVGMYVAQLVEGETSTLLRQVWFPGVARDFSVRVNFCCSLSYGVQTSLCVIAYIDIWPHVKDSVVHVRVWWIMETVKHPACTVGWVAQQSQLAFPGESNLNFSLENRNRTTFVKKKRAKIYFFFTSARNVSSN